METREVPGWAERVTEPGRHVVTCPMCGQAMSWSRYLEHGPDCDGREEP